jgi:hypothetical protein
MSFLYPGIGIAGNKGLGWRGESAIAGPENIPVSGLSHYLLSGYIPGKKPYH